MVESCLPSNHLLRGYANLVLGSYRDANQITTIYGNSALAFGAMRRSRNTLPEIAAFQPLLAAHRDANCVTVR